MKKEVSNIINNKQITATANKTPRLPTKEEKMQLSDYLYGDIAAGDIAARAVIPSEILKKEINKIVSDAFIIVFEGYKAKVIDYAGKIMLVLYDDMPVHTETFLWGRDGQLREVKQDA